VLIGVHFGDVSEIQSINVLVLVLVLAVNRL